MDFPKKQAQRLMPLYLLEYSEKLFENHPDPEAPWGGGGSDYTAGYGIDITNSEISVDTDVIATKSDIASMVTTSMLEDALDDYALKTDLPENVSDLNNDAGYTTQTWVQNQGYITGITSSDVTTALGYTPGTSNFSGSYNDLSDKPTIPTNYVTTDTIQNITGTKTFERYVTIKDITHAHKTSILPYRFDYTLTNPLTLEKTRTLFDLPTSKPGGTEQEPTTYTLATTDDIITSYNDLTDKPTIPTVNNPTITFTQGGVTKGSITLNQSSNQTIALDAGSSSVDWQDITNKPNLLPIVDMSEAFTFTETGNHYPPYKWGENMACTSQWVCYGNVEVLPIIYLQHWFMLDECVAYPQYIWQDQNGYHAVYSTEFGGDSVDASGGRIVLNAPSLGATWTSVSTYPVYGFDKVHNSTITFTQGGVNKGSFTVNQWQDQTIALDAAGSSYSAGTGIDITNNEISIDNTVALKSELFSGDYNDLTNKPTIPDVVSGTNDGTNWTTLTIGSDTYDIPQGGGSTPGMIGEVLYDVPNGQAGVNPITMAHSFADYSYVDIQYRCYDNAYEVKCVRVYDPNGKHVYLDWDVLVSGAVYAKKSIYELSGTTMTVRNGSDMQVWYSNGSTVGTQTTAAADYQHQIKITKVIGYKANSSALTTEEWTFTLSDNTTVTKKIVVA